MSIFTIIALNSVSGKLLTFISLKFCGFFFSLGFYFVLLFGTESSVLSFCLTLCVCLHELRETVTSPCLEDVSLCRSVFIQAMYVQWLLWKVWSRSDPGLLLGCTGGCSLVVGVLELEPCGLGLRPRPIEGHHLGKGAGARGARVGAQHEPRLLQGCARDCHLGGGLEREACVGWGGLMRQSWQDS